MGAGSYGQTLKRQGLQAFLWTQFLGAFNDNVCKFVISMMAVAAGAAAAGADAHGSEQLSSVGVVFILPFLLFSGYAGQVADRFDKRTVLIVTKALEIVAMLGAVIAFGAGRFDWLLAVLFLLALQATFFSPAKYGIVPEILPDRELSRANGLLEMSTFAAIILGTSIGAFMFAAWKDSLTTIGLVLFAFAIVGSLTSLGIPHGAAPQMRAGAGSIQLNPFAGLGTGFKRLAADRVLALTVLGISYFWFLGALLQMLLLLYGQETMKLDEVRTGILATFLAGGIGLGSLIAGRLSGDKVELGLVPLGSIGMGLFSILLPAADPSFATVCACLAALGFSGGLFIVPLNALIQQRPAAHEKGQLLATNNFLNSLGIILASGALWLFHTRLRWSAETVVFAFGVFTLIVNTYVLFLLPDFMIRFSLWMLTHTLYRIRIVGQEHVPFRGPALLVCNHMSHVDGLLVGACVQRFIRFMVYRPYYEMPLLNPIMRLMKAIPVAGGNRQEVIESLERAREELKNGHVVCIFAEGAISRTGSLLPFKRGFERIVDGLDVPVIPVHLDRLWGSIFSFSHGRFFWKRPERIPYPVTVAFGKPLPSTVKAAAARQAIQELGAEVMALRFGPLDVLHARFVRAAKRHWGRFCMADSSGKELNYGRTLIGALVLSRWVRSHCAPDEKMVGLMLPASIGGALANLAITLSGRIPVNLNFTAGKEPIAKAIEQCGIKTILTSRVFLIKAKIEERPGMVLLEDVLKKTPKARQIITAAIAWLLPARLLLRVYRPEQSKADDLATVIFSSGSTGTPKGVMLSHRNILTNVEGIGQVYWVTGDDRVLGVLPFFHSFGFTGTLWLPLLHGFGVIYHANPMDAGTIGELVEKYKVTLLITTPTFLGAYLRKCTPEQFKSLKYTVVGAEKLRDALAREYKEKYGVAPLEGYGCTEMAPVVAVNVPDGVAGQRGTKAGTVGHPLPGVVARVVDPETGAPLEPDQPGLLLVKGGNRMIGYLKQPELDREVIRDGWYVTGDIAAIDEDGFITVTDRLARFSKIGGEMVPHLKIEETISRILDDQGCIVTAAPDESKGEKLVAFYTKKDVAPSELWSKLNDSDLPKLWIPKRENLRIIDALPVLGTGKVNLREVKRMAQEAPAPVAVKAQPDPIS